MRSEIYSGIISKLNMVPVIRNEDHYNQLKEVTMAKKKKAKKKKTKKRKTKKRK